MPAAVHAAVAARDLVNARRLLARQEDLPVVGQLGAAELQTSRGLVAALEGRFNERSGQFRQAMREIDELGVALDSAMIAMALLRAVGPDAPEAREHGERALATFERMGAKPLADLTRRLLAGTTMSAPNTAPTSHPAESVALG